MSITQRLGKKTISGWALSNVSIKFGAIDDDTEPPPDKKMQRFRNLHTRVPKEKSVFKNLSSLYIIDSYIGRLCLSHLKE